MSDEPNTTPPDDVGLEAPALPSAPGERPDHRLIAAYEAALAVASEVTPEAVLQRIVDVARMVGSARYAALGVADERGKILQFITSGITPEQRAAIGPIPEGHGLLGELIRKREPIFVERIADDPRSSGFPPAHPPMETFMGMPILLGNRALGNLYLTDRTDGRPFDEHDLATVQVLAAHAASAIERSFLYGKLREQRDRLRTILDSLPSGVVIVSGSDTAVQFSNHAFVDLVFGAAAPPGVLPTYGRDFVWTRADGLPLRHDERPGTRALRGEMLTNLQLQLERADGTTLPVSVQSAPLRDPGNGGTDALLVVQDVTQLRQAEQLKDDFLSLISHEFRTPLTAIHGGAHLLADAEASLDPQTRRELLGDVVAESDRLDRMLKNLLSLASVMAGRLSVETEPVLLLPLVRKTSDEVAARSPNHRFAVEIDPDTPPVEGDPSLLAQVLRNLYENAVKYSPSGGTIRTTVQVYAEAGRVALAVTDEGLGITREHLPHVFERFNRAGADPTVRGMGLGLYLSQLLVTAQGGAITVTSPGPGHGTTFTVDLPVARGWSPE